MKDVFKFFLVPFFEEEFDLFELLLKYIDIRSLDVAHGIPPTFNFVDKIGV